MADLNILNCNKKNWSWIWTLIRRTRWATERSSPRGARYALWVTTRWTGCVCIALQLQFIKLKLLSEILLNITGVPGEGDLLPRGARHPRHPQAPRRPQDPEQGEDHQPGKGEEGGDSGALKRNITEFVTTANHGDVPMCQMACKTSQGIHSRKIFPFDSWLGLVELKPQPILIAYSQNQLVINMSWS